MCGRQPASVNARPPGQVRVVRDCHRPALARARPGEPLPQPLGPVLHLHRRAAPCRHVPPVEDHVAVQVDRAAGYPRRGRPLVRRKGGEAPRLIEGVRVLLDLLPQVPGALVAPVLRGHPALAADLRRAPPAGGVLLALAGERVPVVPNRTADGRAVGGIAGVVAQVDLAQRVVVVGDRHEVQRRAQPVDAAVVLRHGLAAPEAVGQRRGIAISPQLVRVQRPTAVHVEIAEVRLPQRAPARQSRRIHGHRPLGRRRRRRRAAPARRKCNDGNQQRQDVFEADLPHVGASVARRLHGVNDPNLAQRRRTGRLCRQHCASDARDNPCNIGMSCRIYKLIWPAGARRRG